MTTVTTPDSLDDRTPVLVGAGQITDRLDSADYRALSAVGLAAEAARRAVADTAASSDAVLRSIDTIAATRQFDNSAPRAAAPLGRSTKFPLSVARELGSTPQRAVLDVAGGQSPQHLVNEFAATIARGAARSVLLVGAEAISTVRRLATTPPDQRPDFADDPAGDLEDRGYGLKGLVSREQIAHGLIGMPAQYALLENARRAAMGLTRDRYLHQMAELFAPFAAVAHHNPFSTSPSPYGPDELATVTERNRLIAAPYPRLMVARDQVNQGAAVLMMSVSQARQLGIPESKLVFLHGHADLRERDLLERPDLSTAPSAVAAIELALHAAGRTLDDIGYADLYSCFPIAVSNVLDGLGLAADDPRGWTLTGGLPFFGGAGNNYSMHAIAEAVRRVREDRSGFALVGANGGVLSKYSVGIYGCQPVRFRLVDTAATQRDLDAEPAAPRVAHPHGWARVETYTVTYGKSGPAGVIVGRLDDGGRFLASVPTADPLLDVLQHADQPIGTRCYVRPTATRNQATLDRAVVASTGAVHKRTLDGDFEHVKVSRDGHLLTITINRPDVRNALHPPAHAELDHIFDVYLEDPDLWCAIITGAGEQAFCAGNDLGYTASGKPMHLPLNGFAGLTARRTLAKPVIAAVDGAALGGGLEIALACHLIVADRTATFGLTEVKVGLIAAAGGVFRLPRVIPPKIANELIVTGRRMDVDEAHRLGLVNRIAPPHGAVESARELAAEIISNSPTSVRLSLAMMQRDRDTAEVLTALEACRPELDELLGTQDMGEGVAAFAAKRAPRWTNT